MESLEAQAFEPKAARLPLAAKVVAAAEAGYEQALAQYRATTLTAFQNVADTLHAIEQDGEAARADAAALFQALGGGWWTTASAPIHRD